MTVCELNFPRYFAFSNKLKTLLLSAILYMLFKSRLKIFGIAIISNKNMLFKSHLVRLWPLLFFSNNNILFKGHFWKDLGYFSMKTYGGKKK